ncbi:MAG TPA: hypothetical protein VGE43_01215 [Acidimicrobiales bacterium]
MNEKPNTTATGDVARPAGTTGDSLLQEAKQTVGHMAEGAKEQVVTRVESGKENVAEKIGNVAGALRAAGEPLADIGPLPDLAGAAADKIESIAEYVQSRTIGDLIQEATVFARREPAIFLGSAFGLGLLAGRFLKSSPRREIHPEIQDDMFEEDLAFTGGVGRFESQQRGYGASAQGSSSYGNSTYKASSTYATSSTTAPGIGSRTGVTSSVTSTTAPTGNPGVDRTQSSGFGGYGGSFATGPSTPYDTTGSSISAKPSTDVTKPTTSVATSAAKPSDVGTWGRTEGQTTKPMGTIGESSATTAAPSSVRSPNGSGNGGAPRSTGRP